MHRSGTSCLAGSLQEAGLFLGNVMTRGGRHNAKGNRENVDIMKFQESVLRANGGSWDAPPAQLTWSDEHRKRRDAIIASYGDAPFWGFKDPRTVLTLEMWREAVPDLRVVGTFRHPTSVALSLEKRHGGPRKKWLDLWMLYNERLVVHQQELRFPLLSFDLEDAAYAAALRKIANEIGLRTPDQMAFFEPALRRRRHVPSDPLPPRVAELYARLAEIAQRWPGTGLHGGIPAT
jgi:hypothetical protein